MATRLTPAQIIRNMQIELEGNIEFLISKFESDSGVRVINIEGEEDNEGNLVVVTVLSTIDINDVEDENGS